MIAIKDIEEQLQLFKKKATKCIVSSSYKEGLKYLELYASLAYKYNIHYTDNDVENVLVQLSNAILGNHTISQKKNKIVFYDSFANTRVLAQQYLRAIFSWNSELLYITNTEIDVELLSELHEYPKVKIIRYNKGDIADYKRVVDEIKAFEPEKVLLHITPWDISGFCIWNAINNVDRFLINLTDHAFWLGKSCADYILEFRNYGASLSVYERSITIDRLLKQPYYPIIHHKEFQGFPFKKDKLVAFAGSSLYKIISKENIFLTQIATVLKQNENLLFVLAGHGDKTIIEDFIIKNNLENKFYFIGDRKDISSVFENIDIYVNTSPLSGGLMSQYAAIYNKPIIGYSSKDFNGVNDIEDLLQIEHKGLLVHNTETGFIDYFNQLIASEDCRKGNILHTKDSIISPNTFNERLYENIYRYKYIVTKEQIETVQINVEAFANFYIDTENNFSKSHYAVIWSYLKFKIIYYFPYEGLKLVATRGIKKALRICGMNKRK